MRFNEAQFLAALRRKLLQTREKAFPVERELSDRAFAKRAGLSHGYIAEIEGRAPKRDMKRDNASAPTITRIARYLYACEKTLTQFFSEIEPAATQSPTEAKHHELHDRMQHVLETGGVEAERRVAERLEDVENWLGVRAGPRPTGGQGDGTRQEVVELSKESKLKHGQPKKKAG